MARSYQVLEIVSRRLQLDMAQLTFHLTARMRFCIHRFLSLENPDYRRCSIFRQLEMLEMRPTLAKDKTPTQVARYP